MRVPPFSNEHRRQPLRRSYRALLACCAALATMGAAKTSFAQDLAAAANAFSKAQKAELAGDHESAAELYELADSLAPTPEAMRSAVRARKAAGQLGFAAIDAEKLLQRYSDDKRSKELADATLEEARHKLFRVEVRCRPRACGVVLDNAAASAETNELNVMYVEAGDHRILATFGTDRTDPQGARGRPGDRVSLTFVAPAEHRSIGGAGAGGAGAHGAAGAADRPSRGGLPIWIFGADALITIGLGAATIWSGVDVLQANSAYERNNQNPPTGYDPQKAYTDGRSRETRTNVLVGLTLVAGVSTTVIAMFTRWNTGTREGQTQTATNHIEVGGGATPSGGNLVLSGSF
jgi:hypothetical protein